MAIKYDKILGKARESDAEPPVEAVEVTIDSSDWTVNVAVTNPITLITNNYSGENPAGPTLTLPDAADHPGEIYYISIGVGSACSNLVIAGMTPLTSTGLTVMLTPISSAWTVIGLQQNYIPA